MVAHVQEIADVDGLVIYRLWQYWNRWLSAEYKNSFLSFFSEARFKRGDDGDARRRIVQLTWNRKWLLSGKLPAMIAEITHLRILQLHDQRLTSITPHIGRLVHLQELRLDDNQLTELPDEIGHLTRLEILTAGYNQLNALPPSVCRLTKLNWVVFNHNKLTNLPKNIGALIALNELDLEHNRLSDLPCSIVKCTALETLILSENCLQRFPSEILQLNALDWLNVSRNALICIPPGIEHLTCLSYLNVQGNQLLYLPSELGKLSKLEKLYCSDNDLVDIPTPILALPLLRNLYVSRNCLLETYDFAYERNVTCSQSDQRLPTQLQIEALVRRPPIQSIPISDFCLLASAKDISTTSCSASKKCVLRTNANWLAERWPYLKDVLDAGMEEVRSKTLDLSSWCSLQLARTFMRLFRGRVADISVLSDECCHNVLLHAEQFRLNEPLRALVLYCRARIADKSYSDDVVHCSE